MSHLNTMSGDAMKLNKGGGGRMPGLVWLVGTGDSTQTRWLLGS